ncbi:MAG: hypothetical protein RSI06_07000 [Lachnospiraceae bacterium]
MSIGICDKDEDYVRGLAEYFLTERSDCMNVSWYSKPPKEQREHFDIVLLGEEFSEYESDADRIIYLTEEETGLTDSVFKYQSAEEIVRKVYGRQPIRKNSNPEGLKILIFYTPGGNRRQTAAALKLSEELGAEGEVLYLNFAQCSGLSEILGESFHADLGDVILDLRQTERENIRSYIYRKGKTEYIPPFLNPYCLPEITKEDGEALLAFIREETMYRYLIMDIEVLFTGMLGFWKECYQSYQIEEEEDGGIERGNYRMKEFRKVLEMSNINLTEKDIHKLSRAELDRTKWWVPLVEEIKCAR